MAEQMQSVRLSGSDFVVGQEHPWHKGHTITSITRLDSGWYFVVHTGGSSTHKPEEAS